MRNLDIGQDVQSASELLQNVVRIRGMYLDLMKKAIINLIYPEMELSCMYAVHCARQNLALDAEVLLNPIRHLRDKFSELVKCRKEGKRTEPHFSHSIIGIERLNNIQACAQRIFEDDIPGDFVETEV